MLPALVAGILCTALPIVLFDAAMRTELTRQPALAPDVPIVVELLSAPEPPPPPEPPAIVRTAPTPQHRPRAVEAPSPPSPTGTQTPVAPQLAAPLQLVGRDGAIQLPESSSAGKANLGKRDRNPLVRDNPLPYDATRFDRMMPPVRETLGGEIVRETTITHTWRTRSGTQITCFASLLMAGLGVCGWGPQPRATADELHAMRADPPPPKEPKPDDAP